MHQKELRRRVGEDCALMMALALAGALLAPASPDCPCPRIPATCRRALGRVPGVKPVLPDHGVPFWLVHHDDAAVALVAGVLGRGGPGVYNLAGSGEVRLSDIAKELDWYTVPIPKRAIDVTANIAGRLLFLAVEAGWLEALRSRCPWTAPGLVNGWGGSRHTTAVKRSTN